MRCSPSSATSTACRRKSARRLHRRYPMSGLATRLLLERKDDMKRRRLASPDDGDALALTFAYPGRQARLGRGAAVRGRAEEAAAVDRVMPPVMFLSLIFLSPLGERLGEGASKAPSIPPPVLPVPSEAEGSLVEGPAPTSIPVRGRSCISNAWPMSALQRTIHRARSESGPKREVPAGPGYV